MIIRYQNGEVSLDVPAAKTYGVYRVSCVTYCIRLVGKDEKKNASMGPRRTEPRCTAAKF